MAVMFTAVLAGIALLSATLAAPAVAQDQNGPPWPVCAGVAEYSFWVLGRVEAADATADHSERIRELQILSGLFAQAHIEDTGCPADRQDLRSAIQEEANAASGYMAASQADGEDMWDVMGFFDGLIEQCVLAMGADRLTRLMDEFAANGPPCGWDS